MLRKPKKLCALLAAVIALSLCVPAVADIQPIPRWGQLAIVSASEPLYQDGSLTLAIDPVKAGTLVYVLNFQYNSVKIYDPASKRAGWIRANALVFQQQYVNIGVVICSSVSIRAEANTRATLLKNAPNGAVVNIVSEYSGWYQIQYSDPSTGQLIEGYARTDFIMAQPSFTIIDKLTDVYAMPQRGSKKVGQVAKGATLMILGQMGDYYAVNLRSASGFVLINDVTVE
ncbi:MAG: SH3 domain-containing protein [Oscillospiraceae bacterium]|jgi:hypothetical protein|nr:SH3 domain-containing protein [Oscillospiraceae bacterium]